jgi:post-segregation antitoxin (ccd killing protein)
MVIRMPKMQVYLPDELYEQLKKTGSDLNVSGILQEALTHRLAHIERMRLLSEALNNFENDHGTIGSDEVAAQENLDRDSAIRPKAKRKRQTAA